MKICAAIDKCAVPNVKRSTNWHETGVPIPQLLKKNKLGKILAIQ